MIREIIKLQEQGKSVREMGEILNITKGKVNWLLDKYKKEVELVDIETNEIVSTTDIKFEEKVYHYIESMEDKVNTTKFYNLLISLKDYLPNTRSFTKKTLKNWSKKTKYTEQGLFSMEWIYDLYLQQSNTIYRMKNIEGIDYVSGKNFYGTNIWKARASEISYVINRFIKDGYEVTVERIKGMGADEYNAPLKFYYLPVAKVLWWNYGCDVMQDLDKLPNFLYYRTAGKEDIPIDMRREVIGQHMNNQAIVPKFVLYSWGLPPSCSMEEYFKVMGILS